MAVVQKNDSVQNSYGNLIVKKLRKVIAKVRT